MTTHNGSFVASLTNPSAVRFHFCCFRFFCVIYYVFFSFFAKEEEEIKGKYAARSWDGFVCKFRGVGAQQPVCHVIIYACRQIVFRKVHKIPKRFQLSFGLAPKRNLGNPQIMKYLCQWQGGCRVCNCQFIGSTTTWQRAVKVGNAS